jgi:hypothetical protein
MPKGPSEIWFLWRGTRRSNSSSVDLSAFMTHLAYADSLHADYDESAGASIFK